jgi:hypothetical protein
MLFQDYFTPGVVLPTGLPAAGAPEFGSGHTVATAYVDRNPRAVAQVFNRNDEPQVSTPSSTASRPSTRLNPASPPFDSPNPVLAASASVASDFIVPPYSYSDEEIEAAIEADKREGTPSENSFRYGSRHSTTASTEPVIEDSVVGSRIDSAVQSDRFDASMGEAFALLNRLDRVTVTRRTS